MSPTRAPGLVTERLVLRPAVPGDAGVRRRLWTERDDRVPAHRRIDASGRPTDDDIAARLGDEPGLLTVVVQATSEVIGYCGLVVHGSGTPAEPELAFELLAAHHGRGYATEAATAVLAAAEAAGQRRVWATVWEWNTASRRVLAKLGFTESGRAEPGPHGANILMVRVSAEPG